MIKIKLLAIFLCLILIATAEKHLAYASDSETTGSFQIPSVQWINISKTSTVMSNIGGKAACTASINAYSSNASLQVYVYLEKKNSNGTWNTYDSDYAKKTGSSLTFQRNFSVSSGTYRLRAQYYANGEPASQTTASKTF